MAALPYMQFYVADYLADTIHLDTEQHGAYTLLMWAYWRRGEALPDDDAMLASIVRMPVKKWAKIRSIIAAFFVIADGKWSHKRIDHDLEEVNAKSQKASNAGRASAASRFNKKPRIVKQMSNERPTDVQQMCNEKATISDLDLDITPLPPEPIDPGMVARSVLEELRLSGNQLLYTLEDICRMEINTGNAPEQVRDTMISQYRAWNDAKPRLEYTWGSAKFFGEGHWRDAKTWPWKEGQAPATTTKRRYIGDDPEAA